MRKAMFSLVAAMVAASAFALPRKSVDVSVSGYSGGLLVNFPVLVRISPERISGFSYADCAADGRDIAFADADGNALDREIDTWDPQGESLVWVRLPSMTANTMFRMTYKDPAVTAQPACQTNGAVWGAAGYAGVWHFGEADGTAYDATANALHGALAGDDAVGCVASADAKVGKARYIPSATTVRPPNFAHLGLGDTFTLSGWYKFDPSVTIESSKSPYLFSTKTAWNATDGGWYVVFQWKSNSDTTKKNLGVMGAGTSVSQVTIDSIKSAWVHIAVAYNGKTATIYSNGASKGSPTLNAAAKEMTAAAQPVMFSGTYTGFADEVRIRDAANSADWVNAEYQTVANDAFLSYGAAASLFEGGPSLGVSPPIVVQRGANYLSLVTEAYGVAAPSTVTFLYGVSPDTLPRSVVASSSVTSDGNVAATLPRLQPGTAYYVKAVVEENGEGGVSAESPVVCIQTAPPAELPRGYSAIEYIEGTGTQYIDTGYRPTPMTRTVADYQLTATPAGQERIFAVENMAITYSHYVSGTKYWAYGFKDGDGQWKNESKSADTSRHVFDFNDGGKLRIDGGAVWDATLDNKPTKTATGTLYLGAAHGSSGVGRLTKHRIYSCRMYEDGVIVRDFVPAVDDNGVAGLYDFVEGEFHASAGTGAYVAGRVISLEASEVVADGTLASFALAFPAADDVRSLRAAWGPVHGGDDPADWLATRAVGTVVAGATSASWAAPADWGSDTNLVVRFYFEGDPIGWSNSIFWRNYATPSVTDVELDGSGGDTLVVSGTLDSFPGDACTLSVYTGDSPTTLDHAWTGLPGAVRDATGAFTLTLCEPTASAARYLVPSSTVYATVQAVADGEVIRTAPVAVTMGAAPVFASSSASVSRRTVTFTGKLSDVGMNGAATVALYAGAASDAEEDLVAIETPVTVTDGSAFTFTHTFPDFETSYKWQFRATATAAGGTSTLETRTSVATAKTLDTTTYTWKPAVHAGNWSDAANWTDNQGGDCLGYPRSAAATAVFPATTEAEVAFTEALTIGTLNCSAGPLVTFAQGGASTNATKLTATTITWHNNASQGGVITLDGVAIASTSGETLIDSYRALRLVNGANLHFAGYFGQQARNEVLVADGSWLSCNGTYFGGGTLTISNATFWTRGDNNQIGRNAAGGRIVFQGDHPLLYHGKTDKSFYSSLATANVQLDFLVPVGGYSAAPIQAKATPSYYMGNNGNNAGSCPFTVNVLDESQANLTDATVTSPLIAWPKGISKTMVQEGHLPAYGAATDDAFVWGDATDYPKTLSVTIHGASHTGQLQISGTPEAISSSDVSPGYGYVSLASGTRTCSAPSETVQVSGTKRATCVGWKLYDVDAATLTRTLADSGAGTTCAVTGNGGWRELEWQWRVEYLVTATAGTGGTVSPASQWVEAGATATVTATPDATHAFGGWTGDVSSDSPDGTLSFTVTGAAAVAASFGDAYFVSVEGDDDNDGRSWATALRTIKAGIETCPVGGTVFVGPGTYVATSTVKTADKVIHSVYLNKAIRVIAVEGPARTMVDAGTDANRAEAKVCAEGALLAGFSFKNGKNNEKNVASGVEVTAGTVSNCIVSIRGHWAHQGAAFCLTGTAKGYNLQVASASWGSAENSSVVRLNDTAVLDGLVITNFTYGCGPGGIVGYFVWQGGTSKLRNALIANCQMGSIAGTTLKPMIFLETSGTKLEDSTIANNRILGNYGAVHINNAGASVTRVILWGNESPEANADIHGGANSARVTQSCSENIPIGGSTGNIARNPQFVDAAHGDWHLRTLSPAAGMGAEWLRPDGTQAALECVAEASAFASASGEPLAATLTGHVTDGHEIVSALWDFGDGTTSTDWPVATHTYSAVGTYSATLSVTDSLGNTATYAFADPFVVIPLTCYLREGQEGVYPYDSWEKATDSLAAALAVGSRHIVATNGTYDIPAPAIGITRPVSIVSVEGPAKTIFKSLGGTTTNHRHFNIASSDDILIAGFTLLDGYASSYEWTAALEMSSGTLSNCVVRGTRRVSRSSACVFSGTAKAVDCVFDGHGMTWSNDTGTQSGVRIGGSALLDRCEIVAYRIENNSTSENYDGESPVRIESANATLRDSLVHYCTNGVAANAKNRGPVALLAGRIENCTIAHNVCGGYGGGVWAKGGTIVNSIIRDNTAAVAGADIYSTVSGAKILNSCVPDFSDWVAGPGEGCTTKNPNFDAETPYHLTPFSTACIDTGAPLAWHASALDLDRQPRVVHDGVDMGCYEFAGTLIVPLGGTIDFAAASGRVPFALAAEASVVGDETGLSLVWDFGDGTVEAGGKTATHTYATPGYYTVTATARNGVGEEAVLTAAAAALAVPQTCYVSTTGGHVPPFATWADAATNVAEAVALNPKTVLVTNGTYAVGSDSIVLTSDLELRSVNGPDVTTLDAKGICRNIWLTGAEAVCDGFRLERGKGNEGQKSIFARVEGGTLSNCILTNGASTYRDAAVLVRNGGRMVDCVVDTRNMGGNADSSHYWSTVVQSGGVIERCVIQNHNYVNQGGSTLTHGAVVVEGTGVFRNCLVKDCVTTQAGKEADKYRSAILMTGSGTVENCTVVNSKSCQAGAGITITAAASAKPVVRNNIVWGSVATDGSANADIRDINSPSAPRVTYSCSPDLTSGEGNLVCDPRFLGTRAQGGQSPWALKGNSPLLDAGLKAAWMEDATDLAGAPRIAGRRPAMGCFESVYTGTTMLMLR